MSDAVDTEKPPSESEPGAPRSPSSCLRWRRRMSGMPFVVCASVITAATWALIRSPLLPHQLIAAEADLAIADETISFDVPQVQKLCSGGTPIEFSGDATFTLRFGSCSKRNLTLIPLLDKAIREQELDKKCLLPEKTVVLRLRGPAEECGAQFSILDKGNPDSGKRVTSVSARTELDIVLKPGARLFGNVQVAEFFSANATSDGAASAAILRESQGKLEMAATSMRLHELTVREDRQVRTGFTEPDMGYVTHGEGSDGWQLTKWRLEQFGLALIGTFAFFMGLRRLLREHPDAPGALEPAGQ